MTPAERREMQRLRRQRDALLGRMAALVVAGKLGSCAGMDYVEIHRTEIRKAESLLKRVRAANPCSPTIERSQ